MANPNFVDDSILGRLRDIYTSAVGLLTGIILAAGTNVIGKVRLVTATGGEVTDDVLDAVKILGVIQEATLHASGAETSTVTGSDVDVSKVKEGNFYLDVTAIAGDASQKLDVKIQEKDGVSGEYFDILSFTQVTTSTGSERKNYGTGASELIGKTIRFVATIADGGGAVSFTFSLAMVARA